MIYKILKIYKILLSMVICVSYGNTMDSKQINAKQRDWDHTNLLELYYPKPQLGSNKHLQQENNNM